MATDPRAVVSAGRSCCSFPCEAIVPAATRLAKVIRDAG